MPLTRSLTSSMKRVKSGAAIAAVAGAELGSAAMENHSSYRRKATAQRAPPARAMIQPKRMDTISREARSRNMARIRNADSKPELAVRRALHRAGFRFRLHRRDLPGTPDIVLRKYQTVIFVHGCFWHGHTCIDGRLPKSRTGYWLPKLAGNRQRDRRNAQQLRSRGWRVGVVWECEAEAEFRLRKKLEKILGPALHSG